MKKQTTRFIFITLCILLCFSVLFGCVDEGDKTPECTEHSFGDWEEVVDPSEPHECQDKEYERTCSVCGEKEEKGGSEEDHEWNTTTVNSTCVTKGTVTTSCTVCGKFNVEELPLLEHKCESQLSYDGADHFQKCENCDARINAERHALNDEYICTVCGFEGHEYSYLAGSYDITLWGSAIDGMTALFEEQIAEFEEMYPGIKINATVVFMHEADAANMALGNRDSAADIFCFMQDMTEKLARAGVLLALDSESTERITAANSSGSIKSASVNGALYAYPLTIEDSYYMYYDKSIITNPDDLAVIIADCERAGKNFCFELENAWYNASFFMATGCHSKWIVDRDERFVAVDDTYNSDAGIIAMKGMQIVTKSPVYKNSSSDFYGAGVVISGLWNDTMAKEILGDNYAVTDLPSFTVDGDSYHLSSYSRSRLMGVKPQDDPSRQRVLSLLAEYLSGAKCQLDRYEDPFNWIPSNIEAQASDAVQANDALQALLLQNQYATPERIVHSSWWYIAAQLGKTMYAHATDEELKVALDEYSALLDNLFPNQDVQKIWSVIGDVDGSYWSKDFPMTEVGINVWESEPLPFNEGAEFKCRYGESWDLNFGSDGKNDGKNCVAASAGTYIVRLTLHGDGTATIELIPV